MTITTKTFFIEEVPYGTPSPPKNRIPDTPPPAPAEGVKHDNGKLRYDLFPAYPLEQITRVLTFGSQKYSDRNWEKGMPWGRVFAALMRHLWAWWRGEDVDPETGISHLAHAGCNIVFLLEFERTKKELDNRPKDDHD